MSNKKEAAMIETVKLRIGICGCTNKYHGKFQGRRVRVARFRRKVVKHPITLQLQEFRIEERQQLKTLRRLRCHFFLDAHDTDTFLDVIVPTRDGKGRRRIQMEGWRSYRSWSLKTPPQRRTIIRAIRDHVQQMTKKKFGERLALMTPRAWKPSPQEAS